MDLFLTVKWIGQLTVQFVVHVLAGHTQFIQMVLTSLQL